jgi:glycine/D-amino acid oxidase-like deaminating enzyme
MPHRPAISSALSIAKVGTSCCLFFTALENRLMMNLKSGAPFWLVKNGLIHSYPRLRQNEQCDVLIVGAGITGALIGDHLSRAGMSVCIVDQREAGWGSTAASTALLQYEIDTELQDLCKRYGVADAVLAYKACELAVGSLGALAKNLGGIDFQSMQSLYFASHWYHKSRLEQEGALRLAHGFDLEVLDRKAMHNRFGIYSSVGLLSAVAAEVDPYQLTHKLLARIQAAGGRVHARTTLKQFENVRGGVRALLETTDRHDASDGRALNIECTHLVLAAGYETQKWLPKRVASNRSSYAFISEAMPGELGAIKNTLVWESARPYLYLRRTGDERLLVGGEDDAVDIPRRRDLAVEKKSARLCKRVNALFPTLDLRVAFAWAGTFAETSDGLPFFGSHASSGPNVHYAMAYGGNGITYSLIGAELLTKTLSGKQHECAELFSFERIARNQENHQAIRRRPSARQRTDSAVETA